MATKSSQQFLPIKEIREGVIVLKNGGIRGILMVSSINLALKSREEQEAIIYQFQSFLNSLDFSCQIVMQSRKTNITGYIEKVKKLEEKQENDLLRHQTASYREFLEKFVERESIHSKSFFVVVPYANPGAGSEVIKKKEGKIEEDNFARFRSQLLQRMEFTALGLRRCGLRCIPLTSTEIIELLWSLYHPKRAASGYIPEFPEEIIF